MRESVIDVLFYLFDDILPEQGESETDINQMSRWLSDAGFSHEDVNRAMNWFYELSQIGDYQPTAEDDGLMRIFSPREAFYIDAEGQDFLYALKRSGVIDSVLMEKVIDRALALEEPLSLETLQWVALMVVMNTGAEYPEGQEPWMVTDEQPIIQ